jgi:Spore Coat Protein U domain
VAPRLEFVPAGPILRRESLVAWGTPPVAGWNKTQASTGWITTCSRTARRTVHWGDKSGVDTLEVQATGVPQTVPVYGQIPGGQRVRDGIYSDIITVRVLF